MFLTHIYERRLDTNLRRHQLNAKIAPCKPMPNCRKVERRASDVAPMRSAPLRSAPLPLDEVVGVLSASANASVASIVTMSEQLSLQLTIDAGEHFTSAASKAPLVAVLADAKFDVVTKAPLKVMPAGHSAVQPRNGSVDSAVFTDSDPDCTSNVSIVA